MSQKITRRRFLQAGAAVLAVAALTACGGSDAPASSSSSGGSSAGGGSSSGSSSSGSSSSGSSSSGSSATFDRPHDMGGGLLICGMQPTADGTIVSGASRSVTVLKTKQIIYTLAVPCGNNSTQDIVLKTSNFTAKVDGAAAKVVRMDIGAVEQVTIKPGETKKVRIGVEITKEQEEKNGPSEVVLNWNGKKATFTTKEIYSAVGVVKVNFS